MVVLSVGELPPRSRDAPGYIDRIDIATLFCSAGQKEIGSPRNSFRLSENICDRRTTYKQDIAHLLGGGAFHYYWQQSIYIYQHQHQIDFWQMREMIRRSFRYRYSAERCGMR